MENPRVIAHFLKRAADDLERLKSEAVRIGGDDLSLLAYLIDMALVEAREKAVKK